MKLSILLFCTLMLSFCSAYKILIVFPNTSKSHGILGEGYVRHLLKAGHEITYITSVPIKNSSKNLRQIDVSSNFIHFDEFMEKMDADNFMGTQFNIEMMTETLKTFCKITNSTIENEEVKNLLNDTNETFDAVIVEWLFTDVYSGFSAVFDCPLIWSSSMEPHALILSLVDEPPNPAYIPSSFIPTVPPLTFFERVTQFVSGHFARFFKWYFMSGIEEAIYEANFATAVRKRGRIPPKFEEIKYNASIILGNSHVSIGLAVQLPQNYKPISGYHINEEVAPLTGKFQKLLNESKHGLIYFSLGSVVPSNKLSESMRRAFIETFRDLKQTVIWKFDEIISDLPANVHIVDWAPQSSILAHPNCILFITHGGYLSMTETIHFGKPIIGIPVFGDQFSNVKRAVYKGFGLEALLDDNLSETFKASVAHMLSNPKYTERAKELSYVYHNRVAKPGVELVHWVEHVIHTKGAPELRSLALHVPWYQKQFLDLLAVTVLLVYLIVWLVRVLCCSRKTIKDVTKKNN